MFLEQTYVVNCIEGTKSTTASSGGSSLEPVNTILCLCYTSLSEERFNIKYSQICKKAIQGTI